PGIGVDDVVEDVGQREVDEGQEQQHQARDAHEVPGPGLEVGLGLALQGPPDRRPGPSLDLGHRIFPSMKGQRITRQPGTPASTVRATTPAVRAFSLATARGKKSTITMRRPLSEWNSRASSRPHSKTRGGMLP